MQSLPWPRRRNLNASCCRAGSHSPPRRSMSRRRRHGRVLDHRREWERERVQAGVCESLHRQLLTWNLRDAGSPSPNGWGIGPRTPLLPTFLPAIRRTSPGFGWRGVGQRARRGLHLAGIDRVGVQRRSARGTRTPPPATTISTSSNKTLTCPVLGLLRNYRYRGKKKRPTVHTY